MTLAIVIVSWNVRADLARCLASLRTAPPAVPHELIVVDNQSSDGTAEMVEADFPAVRLIRSGANLGFAAGTNVGIRRSDGDLVLLLNPDTCVPAGAIDRLIERLVATGAAAAGPRIVDGDGRLEISFGRMPSLAGEARQKALGWLYERGLWPAPAVVRRRAARETIVDWVSGACLLVRREAAERAGLLDDRFFLYWEDADFCAALRANGGHVLFTPAAEIVHLRGRSVRSDRRAVHAAYRRGQMAFYRKHAPRTVPLLEAYLRLTGQAVDDSVD